MDWIKSSRVCVFVCACVSARAHACVCLYIYAKSTRHSSSVVSTLKGLSS